MSDKELKLKVELLQKRNSSLIKILPKQLVLQTDGGIEMTVVYYDKHQHEHIRINNVWKIERSINHLIYADGIRVYFVENEQKKGIRIPNEYVTSINV